MYLQMDSPGRFAESVAALPRGRDQHCLILLADCHQDQLPEVVSALNEREIPFFGAVFPGLIHGGEHYRQGAVVRAFSCIGQPAVAKLGEEGHQWLTPLASPDEFTGHKPTIHLFIDCLSTDITGFLDDIFNRYGNAVNYFGAGAGNSTLSAKPAVFTSEGVYSNAAVAAIADTRSRVAVRHGWERVEGPFVATRTTKNIIQELNWEPAMDVYRRALPAELAGVAAEDFFERVTPVYPLSIQKEGREDVVRDPVGLTAEGELICLSDVPANSVMYLVHGEAEKLMSVAAQAVSEVTSHPPSPVSSCLVCDCYSRTLLLGKDFHRELEAMAGELVPVAPHVNAEGAIVLGEIASDGEQSLEFYNKTLVVSVTFE